MKRLPIIRHVRWAVMSWRVERWYRTWHHLGYLPLSRASDDEYLRAIWRGDA